MKNDILIFTLTGLVILFVVSSVIFIYGAATIEAKPTHALIHPRDLQFVPIFFVFITFPIILGKLVGQYFENHKHKKIIIISSVISAYIVWFFAASYVVILNFDVVGMYDAVP